jgi:hypothetical protein
MSAPTTLNIVIVQNAGGASGGTLTGSTVTIAIPSALQTLDSGNASGSGVASGQTGYSSADQLIRGIFRAGVFTDGAGNWYNADCIQKITAS